MNNPIFKKIEQSPSIDFGDILSKSLELYKKVWVQGFVHLLLSMIVLIPFFVVLYVPILIMAGLDGLQAYYEDFELYQKQIGAMSVGFVFLFLFLIFAMSILSAALQMGINAHFFTICKKTDHGEPEDSGYFMFFKGKYLGKLLGLICANLGIAFVAVLLCYFPVFYVMVPLQLVVVIFAFNPDLSVSEIIKASFKLGHKYWFVIFGLMFISGFLAQLGMFLCFVGIFFTFSFIYIPLYYVYKDSIGFEDNDQEKNQNLIFLT